MRRSLKPLVALVAVLGGASAHAAPPRTRGRAPAPAAKLPTAPKRGSRSVAATTPAAKPAPRPSGAPAKPAATKPAPVDPADAEAPPPAHDDPDRERILRLQEAIWSVVHGPVLGRLRVGLRVIEAATGRALYERRPAALMDPASNQKVLATAAALLRLGNEYRFRTEVTGPAPDDDGVVHGDLVLRGNGDPSLRSSDLARLAAAIAARGVRNVQGSVVADPRRIGSDEPEPAGARPQLRVSRSIIEVRVRPGWQAGAKPLVYVRPSSDAFVIDNRASTVPRGRSKVNVSLGVAGGQIRIAVSGRISAQHPGIVLRRRPPAPSFYAALVLRSALADVGVTVRDVPVVRSAASAKRSHVELIAAHDSDPLPYLLRRINKDSDNEYADRLLETLGAEVYGGAPSMTKGVHALREAMDELGLPARSYSPVNGSGLGHANRISAVGLSELLRALYLDPRIGPEMLQSLSVGGIDGTTRNRFRGSPAAERVRAKTGTLNGKSCLSGYVGDGSEIYVFSILVEGLGGRALPAVRHAQVQIVDAVMRYARGATGMPAPEEPAPGVDFENGEDVLEGEEDESAPAPATPGAPAAPNAKPPSPPSPPGTPPLVSQPSSPRPAAVSASATPASARTPPPATLRPPPIPPPATLHPPRPVPPATLHAPRPAPPATLRPGK